MSEESRPQLFVSIAVEACQLIRAAERLLAQVGAYQTAENVRQQREWLEHCTIASIEAIRPRQAGPYQGDTLVRRVEREDPSQPEKATGSDDSVDSS